MTRRKKRPIKPQRRRMHIKDIRKGPIVRSELTSDQLENLRWIWEHIKDAEPAQSFEEFELDFCRDLRPEREIAIWLRMTVATLEFQKQNPSKHSKHSVFSELLAMTVGAASSKQFTKSDLSSLRTLLQTADQYIKNWAEETPTAETCDDEGKLLIAPVAEYRGVALCEIKGDKRAVWKGNEYQTDGNNWLIGIVLWNHNGQRKVLDGRHRIEAMKRCGITTISGAYVVSVPPESVPDLRRALNRHEDN